MADETVHWIGEAPTSLHGNGSASFAHGSGDEDEVTCTLCLTLLERGEHKTPDVGVRPVIEGEREALIRWFEPNLPAVIGGNPDADGIVWGQFDTQRATYLADAILASDWLAAHDARVLEEAQGEIARLRAEATSLKDYGDRAVHKMMQERFAKRDAEARADRYAVTLETVRALVSAWMAVENCDNYGSPYDCISTGKTLPCHACRMRIEFTAALDSSAQGVDGATSSELQVAPKFEVGGPAQGVDGEEAVEG